MKRKKTKTLDPIFTNLVTSQYSRGRWYGRAFREYGDGHQIWVDIKVTECVDPRGIGTISSVKLKDIWIKDEKED